MDWKGVKAPTLEEFEKLADVAFARLPEGFRARCAGLVIRVEDFPDDEVAAEMELESPFDLLGLYQGISHVDRSVMELSAHARHGVPLPPADARLLGRI